MRSKFNKTPRKLILSGKVLVAFYTRALQTAARSQVRNLKCVVCNVHASRGITSLELLFCGLKNSEIEEVRTRT